MRLRFVFVWTLGICSVTAGSIRGALVANETGVVQFTPHKRKLQSGLFTSLDCNAELESEHCDATWTSQFGSNQALHSLPVVIPCGQCITMNFPGEKLQLQGGLDIQGKLVFPDGYKLELESPYIRVQGELHMTSSKIVDGNPDIRVLLTGTDTDKTAFRPADSNADLCQGIPCQVGKKPIVVAGGRLVIRGLPQETPTWVPLHDLLVEPQRRLRPGDQYGDATPPEGCPVSNDGVYLQEDFKSCYASNFGVSRGSSVTFVNDSLMNYNRRIPRQGFEVDLTNLASCLEEGRKYLITARVRLTKYNEEAGQPTECTKSGTGCLRIVSQWIDQSNQRHSRTMEMANQILYSEVSNYDTRYGEWFSIATEFEFHSAATDSTSMLHSLRVDGPQRYVVMEINQFTLRLPPQEMMQSGTSCFDLIVGNGDAEQVGLSPFPFRSESPQVKLVVVEEEEEGRNHFFRTIGRQPLGTIAMTWDLPLECVETGVPYRFQARVRVHTPNVFAEGVRLQVKMKRWYREGRRAISMSHHQIASCVESRGQWTTCDSTYTFTSELVNEATFRLQMYFDPGDTDVRSYDVDDLAFQLVQSHSDLAPSSGIVVSEAVAHGWGVGAEVLITSHTLDYEDSQVRTITTIQDHERAGYVVLGLDTPVVPPTTETVNPDYAVEVALLSRNIVFMGAGDDQNSRHGGHLIVFKTETPQEIRGVEFRNFGQQGLLGRYPIHFHLCEEAEGSVVASNLIRDSNQRCIVIHGTNNVLVETNVAYQTKGHCFMLEDGNEQGNKFVGNLGAATERPESLIPNMGSNGRETDDQASTFWITNPSNVWIGNVAAGSEVNGFWFELNPSIRGPNAEQFRDLNPKKLPLTTFRDNVCHSNRRHGLRTYPDGFIPEEKAEFLNTRSYRNLGDGVFFHNSRNLALIGGVYADNRIQVDFDRADNVSLHGGQIVGVSPEYRSLQESQNVRGLCPNSQRSLIGVELHSFVRHTVYLGATIVGTRFSGFENTGCGHEVVFDFDDDIFSGSFDYFTSVSGISVEEGNVPVSMCTASRTSGVNNIYVMDLDSSLRPQSSQYGGVSAIVSLHPSMTTFIEQSKCVSRPEQCYAYCENTCLRTVTYAVNLAETADLKLRVCRGQDECISVDGAFYEKTQRNELETIIENTGFDDRRFFSVTLPQGSYRATFLNSDNHESWPDFVEETYEDRLCSQAIEPGSIALVVPPVDPSHCENLIRNGDAEDSSEHHTHWLHRSGGVVLVPGAGIGGSNAFGDRVQRNANTDAIVQFLDSRCISLRAGRKYEIKGWVKLLNTETDEVHLCNESLEACPIVGIKANDWVKEPVATMVIPYHHNPFQLVHGVVEINESMATAKSVMFYVERNRRDLAMIIDNFSMELLPEANPRQCGDELVYNGDFQTGDSRFWNEYNDDSMEIVLRSEGGDENFALRSYNGSPQQYLKTGCLEVGERYIVRGKVRLTGADGVAFACNPESTSRESRCPRLKLHARLDGEQQPSVIGLVLGVPTLSWYDVFGIFTADEFLVGADSLRLTFDNIKPRTNLDIDDVSISRLPQNCGELIVNGDMELGYAEFWNEPGNGVYTNVDGFDSTLAIRYSGRTRPGNGPQYLARRYMDFRCLTPGSVWRISAQIKLLQQDSEVGAPCDLSSLSPTMACPSFTLKLYESTDSSSPIAFERVYGYASSVWNVDGFNMFSATFSVPSSATDVRRFDITLRDFNADLDVVLDNFSISPA